jgi:cation diffusion facilitator CzcD-associated flavoprotein CzcO
VPEFIETIIVGGGQAGLAISYYLKQEVREHLVLERAPVIANAWRNQRWDSFTLVTPNFQVRMPGAEYDGNDPYGFMSLREVVKYFDDYVQRYRLPVGCGVEVQGVEKRESVFQVRTTDREYEAKNVVIATGLNQSKDPAFCGSHSRGHSSVAFHAIPQSFCSAPRRGSSDWDGAVGSADCRRTISVGKEGLSLGWRRRPSAPSISRKGHQ